VVAIVVVMSIGVPVSIIAVSVVGAITTSDLFLALAGLSRNSVHIDVIRTVLVSPSRGADERWCLTGVWPRLHGYLPILRRRGLPELLDVAILNRGRVGSIASRRLAAGALKGALLCLLAFWPSDRCGRPRTSGWAGGDGYGSRFLS